MPSLPEDPLEALEDQCAGIVRENQHCTDLVAAALTWLTKGLENHYGQMVMDEAKAKFAIRHLLHTTETLLLKRHIIQFVRWGQDPSRWWILNEYLYCLRSMAPVEALAEVVRCAPGNASQEAVDDFVSVFKKSRQRAMEEYIDGAIRGRRDPA